MNAKQVRAESDFKFDKISSYRDDEELWVAVIYSNDRENGNKKLFLLLKKMMNGKIVFSKYGHKLQYWIGKGRFAGQIGTLVVMYDVVSIIQSTNFSKNGYGLETLSKDWIELGSMIKPYYLKHSKEKVIYT